MEAPSNGLLNTALQMLGTYAYAFLEEFKIMRIIQKRNPTENLFSSILGKQLADATNTLQHEQVS